MNNKYFMRRALKLALYGAGSVSPNPMVGAVLVKNDKIIGEGYHEKFGSSHAEINALKQAGKNAKDATLFVTLEPCCHFGKTPPCTNAILQSGIKKVVIGMLDPNPLVKGKGINILKTNKISTEIENLSGEIDIFYEAFKKFITIGTPYVTLKMAMTLDGKIATESGDSKWISNEKSRKLVHKYRKINDAILIGVGTVIKDNPHLTPYLIKNCTAFPLRIVLDPNLRIPLNSNIIKDGNPTLIVSSESASITKKNILTSKNIKVLSLPVKGKIFDLADLLSILSKQGITSILIEGGATTNAYFFEQKLIDKIIFFVSPKISGGKNALTPVEGNGIPNIMDCINVENLKIKKIDSDIIITGYPEYLK